MVVKIDYENVVSRINDWYILIKQRNVREAKTLRTEIMQAFEHMTENQDVLLYFSLIDSRYRMMLEQYNETGELLNSIRTSEIEQQTDNMIQYYFYFFSGVHAFYKKKYVQAIHFYRIAENKLHNIPDEKEIAEFHHQVAIAYYRIDQHLFSLNHAIKAYETFRADPSYIERTITSKMVIAANKLDLFQYEESERHYKEALELAKQCNRPFTLGLVYRNLALHYSRRNLLSKAEETLKQALSIPEHYDSIVGTKSMFDLSYVLYRSNSRCEARQWHETGVKKAIKEDEKEHIAKFNLLEGLYEKQQIDKVEESLEYLRKLGLWAEIAELTLDVAFHFKKLHDMQSAAHFFEKAHEARDNTLKMTEEIQ